MFEPENKRKQRETSRHVSRMHDTTLPVALRFFLDTMTMHQLLLTQEESCTLLGKMCERELPRAL